jgi:putative salt-induced outer membrane protein
MSKEESGFDGRRWSWVPCVAMNIRTCTGKWVLAVGAAMWMWVGAVAVQAGEEPGLEPARIEEPVVELVPLPEVAPAPPAEVPAPVLPVPVEEDEEEEVPVVAPVPSIQPPPAHRGAEMREAFKGAGSRYGVSGRVIKMPAKKSPKKPKEEWRRSLSLGIGTAQGNSETLRVDAAASATKETEVNYYFLKAAGRYGESDREKDTENAAGEAKYQRKLTERLYAATEAHVFHDPIADLDYRARGSLSLGRHFIRTERTVLSIEAGPGYVAEKKGGETEGFLAGRVAQHLEFLVTPSLQVWQTLEFIPNLEDSRVYFANAEAGLETVLVANLSLKFTLESRYDSNPAEGKENLDLLTTTALSWSF